MHGFMTPAELEIVPEPSLGERVRNFWRRYRWFLLVVVAPTLIAAAYLYGMASDQYVSEAHYLVRAQTGDAPKSAGGLGDLIGLGGSSSGAQNEAMSVSDYLTSHDVVDALQKQLNLVAMFRRPGVDALSKLPFADPTPEYLLKYYRKQVDVYFDTDTGITTLKARAFEPRDAYALSSALLKLGEQRVNELNLRGYADAVELSKKQLDEAERSLRALGAQVTNFRQAGRDVDPSGSAEAKIQLVSKLQGELAAARAQLATTLQLIGGNNPQTQALRQQVRSLEQQVANESSRLAGGSNAIAAGLGSYEGLQMQQQFLAKRYDAASVAFETARQQAVRQQLYLVRVVEPNMPVKSIYPQRALILVTMLVSLLIVYAIGWLIVAGVKEHAV